MAKPTPAVDTPAVDVPAIIKKTTIDRLTKKQAGLLRDISTCYRDASTALSKGDDASYASSMELIASYQDLFNKLTTKQSDAVTAEGLAAVAES